MSFFACKPKSREAIQRECLVVRKALGLLHRCCVPIVSILEQAVPLVFDRYSFSVVSDSELPGVEAKFNPLTATIRVRESVYLEAVEGSPHHRFTLAHEFGHMLTLSEIPDDDPMAGFYRRERAAPTKAYYDPEWQAYEFAADFLAPVPMVAGLDATEIAERFGVSQTVARRQLGKVELIGQLALI